MSELGDAERSGIAQGLRARLAKLIADGRYGAGSRLPPERELASRLHVSRGSVRLALSLLRADGLIAAAPQSGWFVLDSRLGEPPNVLQSFTEMAAQRGLPAGTAVLSRAVRDPTFEETECLEIAVASRVLELERLRLLDGDPVCVDRSVVALDRVPGLESVDLGNVSLFVQLAQLGASPRRTDFTVEAAAVSERDAAVLGLASGAPVLVTDELTYDARGAVLMRGRTVYRANAYRFHASLRR